MRHLKTSTRENCAAIYSCRETSNLRKTQVYIVYFLIVGHFLITVLPPIPTEGTTSEGVNDLTEKVRLLMQETFTKTSLENAQSSKGVKQK